MVTAPTMPLRSKNKIVAKVQTSTVFNQNIEYRVRFETDGERSLMQTPVKSADQIAAVENVSVISNILKL